MTAEVAATFVALLALALLFPEITFGLAVVVSWLHEH
jgi:hypothetical protein